MKKGRPKKAKTFIKSFRVSETLKLFLESKENANNYVIQLIESQEDYKEFASKRAYDDPSQSVLF